MGLSMICQIYYPLFWPCVSVSFIVVPKSHLSCRTIERQMGIRYVVVRRALVLQAFYIVMWWKLK
jgi:hypothetical protein